MGLNVKFTVRLVDANELHEELDAMQRLCLPDDKPASTEHGDWWGVYADGDMLVGFASLAQSRQWLNTGYLCRAGIHPAARGQGLQRKLIQARERRARLYGWEALLSDTRDNPESGNNLIRCGFKLYRPSTPYGYSDTLYWRKVLPPRKRPHISMDAGVLNTPAMSVSPKNPAA